MKLILVVEKFLSRMLLALCHVFDVTPEQLERIRQKERSPEPPGSRRDRFEA